MLCDCKLSEGILSCDQKKDFEFLRIIVKPDQVNVELFLFQFPIFSLTTYSIHSPLNDKILQTAYSYQAVLVCTSHHVYNCDFLYVLVLVISPILNGLNQVSLKFACCGFYVHESSWATTSGSCGREQRTIVTCKNIPSIQNLTTVSITSM